MPKSLNQTDLYLSPQLLNQSHNYGVFINGFLTKVPDGGMALGVGNHY